ncbi:MAG: hypothetical protein LBD29_05055 [Treponema sp.]|jgi:hypothetical protein|nr:hypothetical protein [Treponema sp.]
MRKCGLILGLALGGILSSLHGTDISFEAGVTALDSNILSVEYIGAETDISVNYHFRGILQFDHTLNEHLSLTFKAFQDPLMQRQVLGRINFTYGWFTIKGGPFLGIVNTQETPVSPGMSIFLGAVFPNVAFGSMEAETTILTTVTGYTQNHVEIKVGLAVFPLIVPAISMDIIYTERKEVGYTIGRKQTRYSLILDTIGPGKEYDINLVLGYQELGWTVYAPTSTVAYQLNSVYGGIRLAYQLMPGIKLTVGGLIPIFSWITKEEVQGFTPKYPLFYDFTLGVIWSGDFKR